MGQNSKVTRARNIRVDLSALAPVLLAAFGIVCLVVPILYVFISSFWSTSNYEFVRGFSLENYFRVGSSPSYGMFFLRSVFVCSAVSILSVSIGIICGYGISRFPSVLQLPTLLLLSAPFLVGETVRVVALLALFIENLSSLEDASRFGANSHIATAVGMMQSWIAVPIVLGYLRSGEGLYEQYRVARVSGARSIVAHRLVTLPHLLPTVLLSFTLVLVGTMSSHVPSQFLGGPSGQLYANSIYRQYMEVSDVAFGAVLLLLLFAFYVSVAFFVLRELRGRA